MSNISNKQLYAIDGQPVRLYHGVAPGMTALSKGPVYLAFNQEVAEAYAGEGEVHEAFIALANPLVLSTGRMVRELLATVDPDHQSPCFYGGEDSLQAKMNAYALSLGHDGIVVPLAAIEDEQEHEDWEAVAGSFGDAQVVVFDVEDVIPTSASQLQ